MITFHVVPRGRSIPDSACNAVFLWTDHWNDYSFVTMFDVYAFDENGIRHDLNNVKIGFSGQTEEIATYSTLETPFKKLSETYFSVGTDVSYYQEICKFSENYKNSYLIGIRDVAFSKDAMSIALTESVFKTSHLRSLSVNTIEQQFRRVLDGGVPVTDYDFRFTLDPGDKRAGYELNFQVRANSKPSTNVHAIIGRNGVGKTTLLNAMIRSITDVDNAHGRFEENKRWGGRNKIGSDYFSGVISISFSAFDPFSPPHEQADPTKGTCYFYVGLKSLADHDGARLKSLNDLYAEFIESLEVCLSEAGKRKRWLSAIALLETDDNFSEMGLSRLSELDGVLRKSEALSLQKRMSSGHAIVLLTITKIVARLEEKTLILFDEPESHLHPPLLSALIRSLSKLLFDRNAVAIIATHSPVLLQEVPKSCVWKIIRSGLASSSARPDIETFGENVGILTREVFGLEVSKTGFIELLSFEAEQASTYDQAVESFEDQIGFEGRAILRSLMHNQGKK